jgi:hypothetical protein
MTAVSQLVATPLYTVTLKTSLMCQSQCLAVDTCVYMTYSTTAHVCTLYSTGSTAINVAGLQVYALKKKNAIVG